MSYKELIYGIRISFEEACTLFRIPIDKEELRKYADTKHIWAEIRDVKEFICKFALLELAYDEIQEQMRNESVDEIVYQNNLLKTENTILYPNMKVYFNERVYIGYPVQMINEEEGESGINHERIEDIVHDPNNKGANLILIRTFFKD